MAEPDEQLPVGDAWMGGVELDNPLVLPRVRAAFRYGRKR